MAENHYMMKHYEFTYLTRQDMPEDEAKKLQDNLVALITAKSGAITDLPKSYKKRLAYRIKKQDAAYVNTVLFQAEPAFAVEFKKETDIIPDILRGLVIWYDPEKLKREPRRERPTSRITPAEIETTVAQSFPATEEKKEEKPAAEESKKETKEAKEEKREATAETPKEEIKKETKEEEKPAAAKISGEAIPAKPKRRTKIKAELRDIEEKLDEILK